MDLNGKPYNPKRALLAWVDGKWVGDVPDGPWPPMSDMEKGKYPFIMKPDGVSSLFGPGLADGPFPEHYEPLEGPLAKNLLSSQLNNPVMKIFSGPCDKFSGCDPKYPFVMTTYSSTEHWCTGAITRWQSWLTEAQPQVYVEISEELAQLREHQERREGEGGICPAVHCPVWPWSRPGSVPSIAADRPSTRSE